MSDSDDELSRPLSAQARLDVAFKRENTTFRLRAGALITRGDRVLLSRNSRDPYLYTVGGAIELGETAEEAVVREIWEETGARLEVVRLVAVHESFFHWGHTRAHEIGFYFLVKDEPGAEYAPAVLEEGVPNERPVWVPLAELGEMSIYPTFVGELLTNPPATVRHIVTREE